MIKPCSASRVPEHERQNGIDMRKRIASLIISRLWKQTAGQDLVEYALLAGFVTVAVAATFPPASASISTIFSRLGSLLAAA